MSILSGSIPAELANLTTLTELRLSRNSLSGKKDIVPYIEPEVKPSTLDIFLCVKKLLYRIYMYIAVVFILQ